MRYTQNINLPIVEDNDLYSKEINNLAFEKIDEEIQGLADIVETLDSPENSIADVKKDINDINEQLEQNVQKLNFLEEMKLKFIYDAKCLGGSTDDTIAIQNYINDVQNNGGGVITLPSLIITIKGLILTPKTFTTYNKLTIKGKGIYSTTLVADDNSNDIFIDYGGYYDFDGATNKVRHQTGHVNFENMKIKCTATTKKILCFNASVTQYCDMTNIWIEGFANGAIRFTDAYDSCFYNVQIVDCGNAISSSESAYPLEFLAKRDCTNALHFVNCRLEFCPTFILTDLVDSTDTISSLSARHIYFDNCKFEKSRTNLIDNRPFNLRYHNEFGFNNCFFVNGCDTSGMTVCDNAIPFMTIHYDESEYTKAVGQWQTTQFINCEFVCGQKYTSTWGLFNNCDFNNVTFNNCYGGSNSNNYYCFGFYNNNSFNNIKISSQNSKMFSIIGKNNLLNINSLKIANDTGGVFYYTDNADNNTFNIHNFNAFNYETNYLVIEGDSFAIGTNYKCLKNNRVIINNLSFPNVVNTSTRPNVTFYPWIVSSSQTLNYFNNGYNGQEIYVLNQLENAQIVYSTSTIVTKNRANKVMALNEIVKFKNINNVWYEV